jgi:hypothetical protein
VADVASSNVDPASPNSVSETRTSISEKPRDETSRLAIAALTGAV